MYSLAPNYFSNLPNYFNIHDHFTNIKAWHSFSELFQQSTDWCMKKQIKTIICHYHIWGRMAKMKKKNYTKSWKGCRKTGYIIHCDS